MHRLRSRYMVICSRIILLQLQCWDFFCHRQGHFGYSLYDMFQRHVLESWVKQLCKLFCWYLVIKLRSNVVQCMPVWHLVSIGCSDCLITLYQL